ncbi:hypothetical protein PCL_03366 [Purpureocillium lilacinum]|uniref:Uncharacterized protein n=1 Tax=Purpureocillium lilacinum TaxID=33203 RepID=A0A2U3ENV5_PURLI|nr:hypothetical protein PCL_03366 [Purpureocillium lilacinum]
MRNIGQGWDDRSDGNDGNERLERDEGDGVANALFVAADPSRVSRVAFDSRLSTPELTSPAARGVTKYTSLTSPWSARTTSKATEAAKSLIYMLVAY